jgi:hypothetical protein
MDSPIPNEVENNNVGNNDDLIIVDVDPNEVADPNNVDPNNEVDPNIDLDPHEDEDPPD